MPLVIIQYIMHKYGGKTRENSSSGSKKKSKKGTKRESKVSKMPQISFLLVL